MTQNNLYMEDDDMRLYVDVQPLYIDELENSKNAAVQSAAAAAQSAENARTWKNDIIDYKTNLELFYAQASNGLTNQYDNTIANINSTKNSAISDLQTQKNTILSNINYSYQSAVSGIRQSGQSYINQAREYAEQAQNTVDNRVSIEHLNQSKALETGNVSADSDVLAVVKKYAHSTVDRSKFTVVGNPNITDAGIVSGFSTSNYLHTIIVDYSKPWEIKFRAKFNSNYSNTGNAVLNFFGHNDYLNSLNIERDNSMNPIINVGFTITEGASSRNFAINSVGIEYDTYYDVVAGWTGAEYYLKHKLVSDDIYTEATPYASSSHIIGSTHISSNPSLRTLDIGMTDYNHYFNGSIDLKHFSVKVDGVEVFSGNKTGTDTIKPDNYTVVGTPTISADGIASGFSDSDYLKTSPITLGSGDWEIIVPFYTSTVLSNYTSGRVITRDDNIRVRPYQDKLALAVIATDNSYIIGSQFIPAINTKYLIKMSKKGTTYTASYTTDGINWVILQSAVSEKLVYDYNTNSVFAIGQDIAASTNDSLSVDLNSFKIYVDGDLVYQPCLKIPYTESKTGSKIVDSVYRDRVNDMAEQFGYANYYTLDENNENFTLPQGELYGMIEKLRKFIIERTTS